MASCSVLLPDEPLGAEGPPTQAAGGDGGQLKSVDAQVGPLRSLADADMDQTGLLDQLSERLGRERRPPGAPFVAEEGLRERFGVELAVAEPVGRGPEVVGNQRDPTPWLQQRRPVRQQNIPDLPGTVALQNVGRDDLRDAPSPRGYRVERSSDVGSHAIRSDP